jgi:3-hydroxy-9,10-secoandrosta-1,3,5(10)-triene-9,17-dione monooxygenase
MTNSVADKSGSPDPEATEAVVALTREGRPVELNEDIDPIAAASSFIAVLRSRASETEMLGRLPDATVADLEKARLFDLLVPKTYGGLQCSLGTFVDVLAELGRGDGSVAWVVAIVSANIWMAATFYEKRVTDRVFTDGNFRTASVLIPREIKTKRVENGILIEEGLWNFNSGIYHAHWDILGIPVFDHAGRFIDNGSALVPKSELRLLHDWDSIGLRGSGSTSVAAKNVFVPDERIALLSKILQEDYASTHLRDEPLYRFGLIPFLATKLVFPLLGMAKAALELFLEKAPDRGIAYTWYDKQDEAAITHLQAGEASAKIDAAELMLRRSVGEIEANASGNRRLALKQRARIRRDAGAANQLIWEAIDLLAGASGGSFAYAKHPMNRLWRDARVAGIHGGIVPSSNLELFGRILCNQEPNSPFL